MTAPLCGLIMSPDPIQLNVPMLLNVPLMLRLPELNQLMVPELLKVAPLVRLRESVPVQVRLAALFNVRLSIVRLGFVLKLTVATASMLVLPVPAIVPPS